MPGPRDIARLVTAQLSGEASPALNVFDYLALAPAAGKLLGQFNRMCFVEGTPVAIGWEQTTAILPPGESGGDDIEWQGLDEASLAWVAAVRGCCTSVTLTENVAVSRDSCGFLCHSVRR